MSLWLLVLLSFLQNATFTLSSRSRNSGDPKYHFVVALFSNGFWVLVIRELINSFETHEPGLVMGLYVLFTSLGSAAMMWFSARYLERGKRKVGA